MAYEKEPGSQGNPNLVNSGCSCQQVSRAERNLIVSDPPKRDPDDLITYRELSLKVGLSVPTLRRRVSKGQLPVIKMGGQVRRFHYPTVKKYLEEHPIE